MAKLTDKQKRFVDEYLVDLNATAAAKRAGYSEKSASRIAIELLNKTHVSAEIQKRQAKLRGKLEITQERVLEELAAIAFANGTDKEKGRCLHQGGPIRHGNQATRQGEGSGAAGQAPGRL